MDNKAPVPDIDLTKVPESYWIASTETTDYPPLNQDINVDVAIIGGGLVGISTAFLLKKDGVKVAVIEADRIGQGTTGHTTAKITSQHSLIYYKIKQQMGEELARQYADANENAIKTMANMIKEYDIDCDFEWKPAYVYTQSDEYIQKIQDEATTAADLGIKAHYLDKTPLPFEVKAALRYDDQAQFHPRKYLLRLAKMIPGEGSHIFEQTRAVDIEQGHPNIVKIANGSKVFAGKVIIASHYPFYDGLGLYFARIYPERSYIVAVKINDKFPEGMYITAESPGRSLRSQKFNDEELILVAGEHHKTGHGPSTMEHYGNLRDFAVSTFNVEKVLYRWSTQDCVTIDSVPYVGHLTANTPNLYVATGFRKWGMTNSTVSAMLLRDLIVKGDSPWKEVYSPSRFVPSSAGKFLKENLDVAVNYVSGKLGPIPDDIVLENGTARIVEVDGQRMGIYRDEKGVDHMVDTTCTHVGCELKWNDAEKTWDCPCHGSRFTYEGEIVEGPAHFPLKHQVHERNNVDPNFK